MSTATTYDRPTLYAVPNPPDQQARLGLLLTLRRRARQAFDMLLALPKGAAGWALRHLRNLLDEISDGRILTWAGTRLRTAAGLVRGIGPVPLAAAMLSTPPIWRAAIRLTKAAGSALASLGRGLWGRIKSLLGRAGGTGDRITQALSHAGQAVAGAAQSILAHPAAQRVFQALNSLVGLVRPVSQSVVMHRLLGLLVPTVWIRIALELITLPLLIAPGLPTAVRSRMGGKQPEAPVVRTNAPVRPSNDSKPVSEPLPSEQDETAIPRNRAERRAQQQEQARAKRARAHR